MKQASETIRVRQKLSTPGVRRGLQRATMPNRPRMGPTLIGNHGVLRRYPGVVQAKLMAGSPGDRYEREADRLARAVVSRPEPTWGRGSNRTVSITRLSGMHFLQRQAAGSQRPAQGPAAAAPRAWDRLPQEAQKVLQQSFDVRSKGEWIWYQGGKTAAENYNNLSRKHPEHQRAFLRVYSALKAAGLWKQVKFLVDISGPQKGMTRTPGITFLPVSPTGLISMLSSANFCRDTRASTIAKSIPRILLGKSPKLPGHGWRQVVAPGTPGLHIHLGKGQRIVVHIDDVAPVAGREASGECRYAPRFLLTHGSVDLWRWRTRLFPGRERRRGEIPPELDPLGRYKVPGGVQPTAEWRF